MSDAAMAGVETGLRFAQARAALLADDIANVQSPGFIPRDAHLVAAPPDAGSPFGAAFETIDGGPVQTLERALGAAAHNAITYRELTEQEHALLREVRIVAEESRR
jgi:flagellar basal body rod protein FlgB